MLILHLKRFKITGMQARKMNCMISFPLYDLDLSRYVHFVQPGTCYLYDLFGIVNHFGTMQNGHYLSYVKNERTGEWLQYDDSKCTPLTESQVHTTAAYILFYRRKDLSKHSLTHIVPTLNLSKFPGMPVHIKAGYLSSKEMVGYLIEYREGHACPYKIGLPSGTILYLSARAVVRDPDSEDLYHLNPRKRR